MSSTRTTSGTHTVSVDDAQHIAGNIVTDIESLKERCRTDEPADDLIRKFETEAIIMLAYNQWSKVEYGYKFDDRNEWIPGAAFCYVVKYGRFKRGGDPGGARYVDVSGGTFTSVSTSAADPKQIPDEIQRKIEITRSPCAEVHARWKDRDRSYESGSVGVNCRIAS